MGPDAGRDADPLDYEESGRGERHPPHRERAAEHGASAERLEANTGQAADTQGMRAAATDLPLASDDGGRDADDETGED